MGPGRAAAGRRLRLFPLVVLTVDSSVGHSLVGAPLGELADVCGAGSDLDVGAVADGVERLVDVGRVDDGVLGQRTPAN